MHTPNPARKSPARKNTTSGQQEPNDWFLRLCDPTSVECDEILEHRFELDSAGTFLSNVEHDFSCEDLCSVCGCEVCRSVKPRSRSEGNKRDPAENDRMPRYNSTELAGETSAHTASSSCHSLSCSQSHSEQSVSPLHSTGEDSPSIKLCLSPARKAKRYRRNTLSCGCELGCSDSGDIPPPMALIDVNRLSLQNLAPSSTVSDTRVISPKRCPINCFTSLDPAVDAPNLQLRSNFSLNSSGTGSWCRADRTVNKSNNQPDVSEPTHPVDSSGGLRLRAPPSHLADSSARDSGFSSHSSNSACFPIWQSQTESGSISAANRPASSIAIQLGNRSTELGPIPPPIPPHAPHSFAANAAAAAAKAEKRESTYTPKLSGLNSARASVNESVCGSQFDGPTLRLTPFSLMRKEIGHFRTSLGKSSRGVSRMLTAHQSDSPIWNRSQQSIIEIMPTATSPNPSVLMRNSSSVMLSEPNDSVGPMKRPCPRCINARRYFLEWAKSFPVDGQAAVQDKSAAENCHTCKQHILHVGANLFNRDPLHGLLFLNRHRMVSMNDPQSVAEFLRSASGLCRSRIGAFLGLPRCGSLVPIDVMRCLLEGFDFKEMEIDEALRLTVHHFGIPVESQEIDRFLECLSSRYHETRFDNTGPAESTLDENQVLLLLYSVLLLQTSLYNKNASSSTMGKQTVNQFVRNCQNLYASSRRSSTCTDTSSSRFSQVVQNHPVLSESALSEIYQRIRAKPLAPGPDHTQLVRRISARLTLPKRVRNCSCQWTEERQCMQLYSRLCEPHRRFVCLCTMVQFVLRPRNFTKVALLRYVLLFNDVLILIKHERPGRSSSRHRLRTSDQQQIRRGILTLLRNNPNDASTKPWNRLLATYLQPPVTLFRPTEGPGFPLQGSYHLRPHELTCIPRVSAGDKSTSVEQRSLSSRWQQTGKLFVLKMIPLGGCRLKLFQTEDCRFGLEIWSLVSSAVPSKSSHPVPSSTESEKLALVATLATLTENDYENFLGDLIGCLRETHTVLRELQTRRL